ncbi:dephospho-CoA kinase [Saliterribacillus persicus]|uniref:Dephospho-CoA kinase n=1 Tax=Saliterribacillus persicus TaxID=930114 RepID=A0A368XIM7_9BACI|nr:dephospho-CoA kinase [Saliterribacillus persicus]RCW66327.1 dephospho-CoA kinase [Saliterribacillus persicus]
MTLVIGLTGNIATGKSTISKMFNDNFHIPIIDADIIAREVVEPGEQAYNKIVETFGEEILDNERKINRPFLGKIVFSDEFKREALNKIVHPEVRKEMLDKLNYWKSQNKRAVVLDIPLLFENNLDILVDKTIVVSADTSTQLARLVKRNKLTEEDARKRMEAQMPLHVKETKADAVIDNNGTVENSLEQLSEILEDWKVL